MSERTVIDLIGQRNRAIEQRDEARAEADQLREALREIARTGPLTDEQAAAYRRAIPDHEPRPYNRAPGDTPDECQE